MLNTSDQDSPVSPVDQELLARIPRGTCVSVIGMAAAGKSTLGRNLAELLGWAFVDSDNLIEAAYGTRLQNIADALSKEEFLDMEETVISQIRLGRCVISTGGSVVYRAGAVAHLKTLGPLLHIDVPLPVILERIARKPDRGLAIAPGQTVEDLFYERQRLYEAAADLRLEGGERPAREYAREAAEALLAYWGIKSV